MNQTPTSQKSINTRHSTLLQVALIIYLIAIGIILFLRLILTFVYQVPFWDQNLMAVFIGLSLLTSTYALVEDQK